MAEEKVKFLKRIAPDTDRKVKAAMPLSNCKSQNEFVEKALQFYCEYLAAKDTFSALPPVLLSAIRAAVRASEDRICRLLFKMAVEQDMTMNVLAAGMEITTSQLDRLRPQCVQHVKKTGGRVTLDEAVEYQRRTD